MFIIKGKYNQAKVFATQIENECIAQITDLCNQEWLKDCTIAIMPDCHSGKGCTIGTTIHLKDKVCPSLVGVDIGCGMLCVPIPKNIKLHLDKIDQFINENIPSGFEVNNEVIYKPHEVDIESLHCFDKLKNVEYLKRSVGSLGGGNHFIEINKGKNEEFYLVIHSGSRNLGKQIAEYYQDLADEHCNHYQIIYEKKKKELIENLKEEKRHSEIQEQLNSFNKEYKKQTKIVKDLCYLEDKMARQYLDDVRIATQFAYVNRKYIAKRILEFIYLDNEYDCCAKDIENILNQSFETIHNYIDKNNILRKGAISAQKGEQVLIPINMRDGSIVGVGKGNAEYNYSGPHGAGRLMSRSQAKECICLKDFEESMKGIYSSSVCVSTLDESPMAYKSLEDITQNIEESVDILEVLKPVYNFKAHDRGDTQKNVS